MLRIFRKRNGREDSKSAQEKRIVSRRLDRLEKRVDVLETTIRVYRREE